MKKSIALVAAITLKYLQQEQQQQIIVKDCLH